MPPTAGRPTPRRARWCAAALLASMGGWAAAPSPSTGEGAVTLTVLATNDLHNQLAAPEHASVGGMAHLAAHLDAVRAHAPDALHVDAGDMTGSGGGIARMFGDEPTIEAMNLVGLDAVAAGNHEFDDGLDHLRRLYDGGCRNDDCGYRHDAAYDGAEFATLGANVVETATGSPILPGWTLRTVSGVQVGIVGLSTIERSGLLDPPREVEAMPLRDAVNPAVEDVVAAGADVVVVVWHEGSRQARLAPADPNGCEGMWGPSWNLWEDLHDQVDLVIDGHTHQAYVCDRPGGPLMTQAYQYGMMFTEVTLVYDPATDHVVDRAAVNRWVTHDLAPDPEVAALVSRYQTMGSADAGPATDLDGDRLGDGYEAFVSYTDPRRFDTDGDELDDGREVRNHRTDPRRRDTDRGGVSDGAEVDAGTDPRLFLDDGLPSLTGPLSPGTWAIPAGR